MKRGTARHHKIDDLADALDCEHALALGLLACLWDWTAETCPAGDIGRASNRTIASRAGWKGDPELFVAALVKVRLVDKIGTAARLIIHDWVDHCDEGIHTYLARRKMRFADGSTPRLRTLHSTERDEIKKHFDDNPVEKVEIQANNAVPGISLELPQPLHGVPHNDAAVLTVRNDTGTVRDGTSISPPKPKPKPPQTATRLLSEKVWTSCTWRKKNKADGLKAIDKAIVTVADREKITVDAAAQWLADKAAAYSASPLGMRPDREYRPHPATWFNAGSYDDDPDEWRHKPSTPITAKAQARAERDAREPAQEIDFEVMRIGNQ